LKDRGIDREPQQHEGPQVADRIARVPDKPTFTRRVMARLKANVTQMRGRLERDTHEGASIDTDDMPKRYRKGWMGTALRDWARRVSVERTRGQDRTSGQMVDDGAMAFVADWSEQEPPSPTLPPLIANPTPPPGPIVRHPELRQERVQTAYERLRERARAAQQPPASLPRQRRRDDEER
jgi:hypothetical protein